MRYYTAAVSAEIPASAETVYHVLIDYHNGHPHILPKPYFESVTVLEGGVGDGTVVQVQMNVYGVRKSYTLTLHEIERPRKIVEVDEQADVETTFEIETLAADRCRVTISTRTRAAPGLAGIVEAWFTPAIMRRIFRQELQILAQFVRHAPDEVAAA